LNSAIRENEGKLISPASRLASVENPPARQPKGGGVWCGGACTPEGCCSIFHSLLQSLPTLFAPSSILCATYSSASVGSFGSIVRASLTSPHSTFWATCREGLSILPEPQPPTQLVKVHKKLRLLKGVNFNSFPLLCDIPLHSSTLP